MMNCRNHSAFRFDDSDVDWTTVVRLGLVSVAAVVFIALVVQLVKLVLAVRSALRFRSRLGRRG